MGTAERRQRERVQRANQIQEAAERLFLEKGYQATTIQGIAREAELSIGTIYFYFKTKEEIYASINLRILESYEEGLTEIISSSSTSPEEKLEQAWGYLHEVFCQSPLSLRALAHGQLQGSLQNISPDLLESLNDTGRKILNKLAAVFREGIEAGSFLEANPIALADLLWGTFAGVVYWEEAKRVTDSNKDFLKPTLTLAFQTLIRGCRK
jgi:AcrR family transcriptional regulator